ncbi:PQQ-binding-like beta-propeller repeat protein [Streptomyces sp. NPDC059165]|uniref:outer membrane protein assembly factor BamB family protein n=1 Tax=Streptomyces sp. NPDC059165 TaxID=3346751 RepID=UPI0036A53355
MEPVQPLQDDDPRRIGPYVTLSRFRGTASTVQYLAADDDGTVVVVSLARPALATLPAFRHRFAVEARIAERLSGGWVLAPRRSSTEGAELWTASAYVPSLTLAEAIALGGPLPERAVRVLGAGLAETLSRVHATGTVLHGLAPETVLLAADGPRLAAFGALGAAAHAEAGPGGGLSVRLDYLTPEQLAGEKPGTASDVFVLGLLLAYAATGTTPFADGTAIADAEPGLDGVPVGLRPLVASCLAKSPADRPTAGSVAAALALEGAAALAEDGWLPVPLVTALDAAEAEVESLRRLRRGTNFAGDPRAKGAPGGTDDPAGTPSGEDGAIGTAPEDGRQGPHRAATTGTVRPAVATGPAGPVTTGPGGSSPGVLLPAARGSQRDAVPDAGGGTPRVRALVPVGGGTARALSGGSPGTTTLSLAAVTTTDTTSPDLPGSGTEADSLTAPAAAETTPRALPAGPDRTNASPAGLPADPPEPLPGRTEPATGRAVLGAPGTAGPSVTLPDRLSGPAGGGADVPKSPLTASVLAAKAGAERRALVVGAVAGAAGLVVGGGLGMAVAGRGTRSTAPTPAPVPTARSLPGVPPTPLWAYRHTGNEPVQASAWRGRVLVLGDAEGTTGIDLRTGRRLWAQPSAATTHRPVVTGDALFVIGTTHFVWLSPLDGTVRARVAVPAHVSAVAAADGRVVWFTGTAGAHTDLFGYDTAARKELWRTEVPAGRGRDAVPRYQGVAVRPDGILVRQDSGSLTSQQQKANKGRALFALYDRASGRRLWGKYFGTVHQDAVVCGEASGRLFAVQDRELHAYDTDTGKRLWRAAGAAGEGLVHGGTLYVPTAAHQVYALDTATGGTRWTQSTESGGAGEPRLLLSSDGRTAVVLDSTQVTAFATADGSRLWKFQDAGDRTPASGYQGVSAGRTAVVWRDRTFYALPLGR